MVGCQGHSLLPINTISMYSDASNGDGLILNHSSLKEKEKAARKMLEKLTPRVTIERLQYILQHF